MCGERDALTGLLFVKDLASRLSNRVQLTTDGHRTYLETVEAVFGSDVDYAMLIKIYGSPERLERRYSPGEVIGTETHIQIGEPDPRYINTSYVERQNLTMRMSMRRFTRLTNAFSKKVANHEAAVALHFMYYNFCRYTRILEIYACDGSRADQPCLGDRGASSLDGSEVDFVWPERCSVKVKPFLQNNPFHAKIGV